MIPCVPGFGAMLDSLPPSVGVGFVCVCVRSLLLASCSWFSRGLPAVAPPWVLLRRACCSPCVSLFVCDLAFRAWCFLGLAFCAGSVRGWCSVVVPFLLPLSLHPFEKKYII